MRRLRKLPRPALALVAVSLVGLGACGSETGGAGSSGKPLVVATTTQLADFATVVGGDDVEVYAMLRPNVDAHDFEPSPADLDALARADVILENGLGLEEWLDAAVEASGTDTEVVDTSEGATLLEGAHDHADDEGHEGETEEEHAEHADEDHADDEAHTTDDGHDHEGEWNPHLWFDPRNAQVMVGHVADAIAAAAPDAADAVQERAEAYDAELVELDTWIAEQIDGLTDKQLVTDHDAFPYYVDRYGMEFVGSVIPSFDSSAEISPADLTALAKAIDERGVKAVFTERSLPPKSAEALARQADVEVVSGDDGLYGDSLGPKGSDGATYLTMMRHNTTSIVEHLS